MAGPAAAGLGPPGEKGAAGIAQAHAVCTGSVDDVLQGGAKGELIGAGGKKTGAVRGVLHAVGERQQFRVGVERRAKQLVNGDAGQGGGLAADEKDPFG